MKFQTSVSPLLEWAAGRQPSKLPRAGELQDSHWVDTPDSFSVAILLPSPAQRSLDKTPCEGKQCAARQVCKVVNGQARCVAPVATCRAQGDPHYTTFDGRYYDMMGTCLYSLAELQSNDDSLPAFSVDAKNEHRGSRRVSYVGLVTVRAYNHAVSLARGEVGFARVRIQRSHQSLIPRSRLPVRWRRQCLGVGPQTQALCHGVEGAEKWAKGVGAGEGGFENQWQNLKILLFSNSISKSFKNAQRYG